MTGSASARDPAPSTCPRCGKVRYLTRMYPGAHMSVYRCGDFWHVGNLPDDGLRDHRLAGPRMTTG